MKFAIKTRDGKECQVGIQILVKDILISNI